ncbi:hypothetical protein HELRODRAFT_158538 [Helobdella robusta]|uniref:Transposable element P transposase-like RNase H domain-containing protein n=1 Tax=Helobdella robusta TaxID=6412 RepID=T1EMX8_HELRO|nr:hypothetical protein HELRODRAFT_158538 [Helobdella robusta]ESO12115.1 hypothetical protein HELRODRAFT_158538 [Helobdella robusta]
MSIREQLIYLKHKDVYSGYEHFGGDYTSNELATQALVLIPIGTSGSWKYPLAYFLFKKHVSNYATKLMSWNPKNHITRINITAFAHFQRSNEELTSGGELEGDFSFESKVTIVKEY